MQILKGGEAVAATISAISKIHSTHSTPMHGTPRKQTRNIYCHPEKQYFSILEGSRNCLIQRVSHLQEPIQRLFNVIHFPARVFQKQSQKQSFDRFVMILFSLKTLNRLQFYLSKTNNYTSQCNKTKKCRTTILVPSSNFYPFEI